MGNRAIIKILQYKWYLNLNIFLISLIQKSHILAKKFYLFKLSELSQSIKYFISTERQLNKYRYTYKNFATI